MLRPVKISNGFHHSEDAVKETGLLEKGYIDRGHDRDGVCQHAEGIRDVQRG